MKSFVIDVAKCTGCYCCQLACKDEHCSNDWTPYAKPQPEVGHFWGKLNEYVRGQVPQVKMSYVFIPCQHCINAPCIDSCPVEDGIYTRDDGLVIINPKKCTGCQLCIDACPYKCIFYNASIGLAQKCTGCAHLLDRNGWDYGTRCSDMCTREALIFGDESAVDTTNTETYHPEYGLTTRVHYKNLPKRFIAGTVYTPSDNEVAIGATCTLTSSSNRTYTQTTDNFGDFWFNNLDEDNFTLTITNGSKTTTLTVSTTEKDIGLGDIPLN
jgi:Fe-S-cluster-containing dehydrogenase component